nr:hypothetical protein CFP56_74731 [Quercus suber]
MPPCYVTRQNKCSTLNPVILAMAQLTTVGATDDYQRPVHKAFEKISSFPEGVMCSLCNLIQREAQRGCSNLISPEPNRPSLQSKKIFIAIRIKNLKEQLWEIKKCHLMSEIPLVVIFPHLCQLRARPNCMEHGLFLLRTEGTD